MSNKKTPVENFEEQYTVKELLRLSHVSGRYADWCLDESLDTMEPLEEGPVLDRVKRGLGAVRDFVTRKPPVQKAVVRAAVTPSARSTAPKKTGLDAIRGAGIVSAPTPFAKTPAGKTLSGSKPTPAAKMDVVARHARRAEDEEESSEMSTLMDDMRRISGVDESRHSEPRASKERGKVQSAGVSEPSSSMAPITKFPKPGVSAPRPGTLAAAHAMVPQKKPPRADRVEDVRVEDYNREEQRMYAGITRSQTYAEAFDEAGLEEGSKEGLAQARRQVVGGGKHANFEIARTNKQDRRDAKKALKQAAKGSDDAVEKIPKKAKKANPWNVS